MEPNDAEADQESNTIDAQRHPSTPSLDYEDDDDARPSGQTLNYWMERLQPLIGRHRTVVICNRTGTEGRAVYAGTTIWRG